MVFETYLREFFWTKCPRTISRHKTTEARFFLFQWGWNFNHFLWFWHLWCSLGWSFLTNIFSSFFRVTVFFALGFESLTGVSGTVAALTASLLAGVVFSTSWKVHGQNLKWTNITCISNIQTAKSCPIEARVVPKEMLIVKDTAALKNGDEAGREINFFYLIATWLLNSSKW